MGVIFSMISCEVPSLPLRYLQTLYHVFVLQYTGHGRGLCNIACYKHNQILCVAVPITFSCSCFLPSFASTPQLYQNHTHHWFGNEEKYACFTTQYPIHSWPEQAGCRVHWSDPGWQQMTCGRWSMIAYPRYPIF